MAAKPILEDEDDESQRPTTRPAPTAAAASGLQLRQSRSELPIQEILARFELGDFLGALSVASTLFDDGHVPVLSVELHELGPWRLNENEDILVSYINGVRSLEEVLGSSDLPFTEGLRVLCKMVEKGLVFLR